MSLFTNNNDTQKKKKKKKKKPKCMDYIKHKIVNA